MAAAFPRQTKVLAALLLAVGAALLVGTLVLSLSMLAQTRDLDNKVKLTDDIADANVRTLSQVQRELLRLDVLIQEPDPHPADLQLQGELVSQRVQEGTLPYQRQTLGTEELLMQSRALAREWRTEGVPLLREVRRGGPKAGTAAQDLHSLIGRLEINYNELVSKGENNRKLRAGQANAETKVMVERARWLLGGLVVTFFVIGLYSALAGMFYRNFHRQRERANADLRSLNEQLEKHAHVVRETDNMVIITDAAGTIEWVNQAFERSTGFSQEHAVGKRPGSLLQGPDTDPDTVAIMRDAVADGEGFVVEVLNYTRTGQPYWSGIETSPIRDRDGQISGFVSVQRDITERRRHAELLIAAKETAEATARAKTNFLASMSHEIRTPLNAVLGFTDLLLLTNLDAQQREYVRTAHNSGQLLRNLVNDILDFSALDTMKVKLERRCFELRDVVDETLRMFAPEAGSRGLALTSELGQEVPEYVLGDETRVRQVLVNLVGNAVKFTETGGVRIVVRGSAQDGSMIEFRVSDSGIGIPADQQEKLFQPFTQGDASTTRRFGGTGLGLAICRLLMDRMGGEISVDSVLGKGSTFVVRVPLEATDAPDGARLAPADRPAVSSLRVLVADDDVVNQTVVAQMLRRFGIEADVVSDGNRAVEAATTGDYDTVLMDVHMPGMDGVEATAHIRAAMGEASPRIIAVTASALEGDRERLLGNGMDDYVSKPLQMTALGEALERALGQTVHNPSLAEDGEAVDVERFVDQTGIDDRAFLVELVGQLLPQAEALGAEAPDYLERGQLEELRRLAHTVGGAAASCAAPGLAASAALLEVCCAQEQCTEQELAELIERVAADAAAVRRWHGAQAANLAAAAEPVDSLS